MTAGNDEDISHGPATANGAVDLTVAAAAAQKAGLAAVKGSISPGERRLPAFTKFMLEPHEVAAMQQEHGMSLHDLMQLLVAPAALLARAPTSQFPVGAIGLGVSGRLYAGVNLEFPGLPLQHSVHAEQFLITNAAAHGERGLTRLTVNAAPCGHCRQFIAELVTAEDVEIVYKGKCYHLDDILVDKFCPSDLIDPGSSPLLLEPQKNLLQLSEKATAIVQSPSGAAYWEAASQALKAAQSCYAPYSRCPAGLALVTESGAIYSGGVIESCAYNPTINPLQAACISFVAHGEDSFSEVTLAVLVELHDPAVSYEESTEVALRRIAPEATLHVLNLVPLQY